MRVDISKFGDTLVSRPHGREAALALAANVLRAFSPTEPVELDLSTVHVLTPSWMDEFLQTLRANYKDRVKILPAGNASVQLTLETIGEK